MIGKIIIEDNHAINSDEFATLVSSGYELLPTTMENLPDVLDDVGENIKGFIFTDMGVLKNALTLIRKGRDKKHHTWCPVAMIGESNEGMYLPLGCRYFSNDEYTDLSTYFDEPLSLNILVVEDDPDIQDLLVKILSTEYQTDSATSGDEGIEQFFSGEYDLVVLDFMLPGSLDGQGVLNKIRSAGDETPVVVITAFHEKRREDKLYIEGANGYLIKPFSSIDTVADTIRDVLINEHQTSTLKCGDPSVVAEKAQWQQYSEELDSVLG